MSEIEWWEVNTMDYKSPIHRENPLITITSDACKTGFGAVCNEIEFNGHWNVHEKSLHINILELKAAFLALEYFAVNFKGHCRLRLDNTTAIYAINQMGSCKSNLINKIAKNMWVFALDKGIWLSAVYVPSKDNEADKPSRRVLNDSEFMLNKDIYKQLISMINFEPKIDIMASRVNFQVKPYISYKPDVDAKFIDAFSIEWSGLDFYCFPPFNMVLRCLQKIIKEKASGILIVPYWEAQPFFPLFCRMIIGKPILLPYRVNLLVHPTEPETRHRMKGLKLIASLVSGKNVKNRGLIPKLQRFC